MDTNFNSKIENYIRALGLSERPFVSGQQIVKRLLDRTAEFQNLMPKRLSDEEFDSIASVVWWYIVGDDTNSIELDLSYPFDYSERLVTGDTMGRHFSFEMLCQFGQGNEGERDIWFLSLLFRYRYCCLNSDEFPASYIMRFANQILIARKSQPELQRLAIEFEEILKGCEEV